MDRKLLLVFALTFLVMMLFQPLMKKYGPQPPAKPENPQPAAQNQAQLPTNLPRNSRRELRLPPRARQPQLRRCTRRPNPRP